MAPDIYWIGLFVLVPVVALAAGYQDVLRLFRVNTADKEPSGHDEESARFQKVFMRVYLLVMGSEWLQGPYLYSLFRDEKALGEQTVAILYITTYLSAAVSAFFTGYLADKYGRRAACMIFCGLHSLASISVKSHSLWVLVMGRVLAGIGLNLLWTVFESWMVTEYNAHGINRISFPLSAMFGMMTKYNCLTAILAGVISHYIVLATGSKTGPFIVGAGIDACAVLLMLWTWNENKGTRGALNSPEIAEEISTRLTIETKKTNYMRVWVLSFASCCFEGTMFLFTFLWPETLQEAHNKEHPDHVDSTPYGVTFATFMATMVLGAMLFSFFMGGKARPVITERVLVLSEASPTILLGLALVVSSSSFLVAALSRTELHSFLAFLLLEFCNGIYVPSMAYHRGMVVDDSSRALVYGLMNIPLFIFVVIALLTTSRDGAEHKKTLFTLLAVLPLVAAIAIIVGFAVPTICEYSSQTEGTISCDDDLRERDATGQYEPKSMIAIDVVSKDFT
ncbi:hypothetical protein M426DRAFT_265758 [Hypoxylon sp. CI-4A]|nr:hypothetical protein M426DRAFT_265758 [Hypoxylon sp. CI-4A]